MRWLSNLREDLRVDGCRWLNVVPRVLFAPRTQALVLVRLAQASPRLLGPLARRLNMTHNGCDISPHATIGAGLQMPHPQGIVVGPEVVIGPRVRLGQHSTLGMGGSGSPRLGAGVTIGIGAVVFGGIGLGEESVVAANSVLRIDVPARTLAAGNPAVLKGVLQRYRE